MNSREVSGDHGARAPTPAAAPSRQQSEPTGLSALLDGVDQVVEAPQQQRAALLQLQRHMGNRATCRLLSGDGAPPNDPRGTNSGTGPASARPP